MFLYLASPYSGSPEERQSRFEAVCEAAARLLNDRIWVYSPIAHCHSIADIANLPFDYEFWQHYNRAMIEASQGLAWMMLDGWRQSKGLAAERAYARKIGKPVYLYLGRDNDWGLYPETSPDHACH